MIDVLLCYCFEHVTFLSLSFISLCMHYKPFTFPNYIGIPMFLNNDQLSEVLKYFKAKMKACLKVIPLCISLVVCMHACCQDITISKLCLCKWYLMFHLLLYA